VPEDESQSERRRNAAEAAGVKLEDVADGDVTADAEDEFLTSEVLALWAFVRQAREALK
jgi:hypothetical protein